MGVMISAILMVFAGVVALPVVIFFLEIAAATILPERVSPPSPVRDARRRLAVLVPAHNESTGLLPTLADIKSQLHSGDRLLVVADNCSDNTARVASTAGAEVVERMDPAKVGKGYALDFGINHLATNPPDVLVVIDADCRLASRCLDQMTSACTLALRPVQALNLMTAPDLSPVNFRVAEFAWRVKNWVRPLGLAALNLPCQLLGTGMAFPWDAIRTIDLATGSIVEDVKLGLDLALADNAPVFCPSARVTSQFPLTIQGAETQRRRWEHGHFGTILTVVPRLLLEALKTGNLGLLTLVLDIAVPPLSFLGILVVASLGLSGLAAACGFSPAALIISVCTTLTFLTGSILAWWHYGRDLLPAAAITSIATYIVAKLPIYYHFIFRRTASHWVRTDRRAPPNEE